MAATVRFAPSPTGFLHVGNVRTALFNWLFARAGGGRFVLRLDDTDTERSEARFAQAILDDLTWLGLAPDDTVRQSDRTGLYDEAARRLRDAGLLYPCYETAEELERRRRRQMARHEAPLYDRAALALTVAERQALEAAGRRPHWRFRLDRGVAVWDDLVRGRTEIDLATVSDPVLIRSDGRFLYTLPSVVDDIALAISHVIRGEDHVTNTATQIALFRALGSAPPAFAHHPLLLAADGGPLSKRLGSLSVGDLRAQGFEPLALLSLLARLGTSLPVEPFASLSAMAADFDLATVGRAPARFDPTELDVLNARLLHGLPYEAVATRLAELGIRGAPERRVAFWEAVRGNLIRFADAATWWTVVEGPSAPVVEDPAFLAEAARHLAPGPFDEATWGTWTKALATATGAKGRALYHPLRLALTGREHGPELKKLLVLIGPERARARLLGHEA